MGLIISRVNTRKENGVNLLKRINEFLEKSDESISNLADMFQFAEEGDFILIKLHVYYTVGHSLKVSLRASESLFKSFDEDSNNISLIVECIDMANICKLESNKSLDFLVQLLEKPQEYYLPPGVAKFLTQNKGNVEIAMKYAL